MLRDRGGQPAVVTLIGGLPGLAITECLIGLGHGRQPAQDEVQLDRIGFSRHRVPSLSKTAIRSSTETASPELSSETRFTKRRIASLAPLSLQLERGSTTWESPYLGACCLWQWHVSQDSRGRATVPVLVRRRSLRRQPAGSASRAQPPRRHLRSSLLTRRALLLRSARLVA